MTLLYIRHAESQANVDPSLWRIPSDSAVALTSMGRSQTHTLSQALMAHLREAKVDLDSLLAFSSPMLRSRQTAELLISYCRRDHPEFCLPKSPLTASHPRNVLRCNTQRYTVFQELREFYAWVDPCEDLSDWDFQHFTAHPDMPGHSFVNINSWSEHVEFTRGVSKFLLGLSSKKTRLVFSHHFTINALIYHEIRAQQLSPHLPYATHQRLAPWFHLNTEQLSAACHRVQLPHACAIAADLGDVVENHPIGVTLSAPGEIRAYLDRHVGGVLRLSDLLLAHQGIAEKAYDHDPKTFYELVP